MKEETVKIKKNSLYGSLKERRVPQILGLYLGAGWGLIQFIEWIVQRYGLSPYLPDFSLVILFSLLPTVAVIAYFHGRPGRDRWTLTELVTVPVNLIFTMSLLFTIFSGKDLGAATKTLLVQNEEGHTVERVIAKSEFRKKITLFNIKNDTGDEDLNWLESGLPFAVHIDLMQDLFMQQSSQLYDDDMYEIIKRAGFTSGVKLPLPLMQQITKELHDDYFITGKLAKDERGLILTTRLYDAKLGKLIAENSFSSGDFMALVDQMSTSIKHDLEIPAYRIESIQDLPIKELLTESNDALRYLVQGIEVSSYHNDYPQGAALMQKAVLADPSFAIAHFFRAVILANTNQSSESIAALKKSLKFDYKLPQKLKFQAKDVFFIMTGKAQKRIRLLKMQIELYPDSIDAQLSLASIYTQSLQYEKAIAAFEDIRKIAPKSDIYLDDIGFLFLQLNKVDIAFDYIQRYADKYPEEPLAFNSLALVYTAMGKDDLATESYEKALLLDQSNMSAILSLSDLDLKYGRFVKAQQNYQNALIQTDEPRDKYRIYKRLATFHQLKGQPIKALEMAKQAEVFFKQYRPPLNTTIQLLIDISRYIDAGEQKQAFELLATSDEELKPPFDKLTAIGYAQAYISLEDAKNAEKYIPILDTAIESLSGLLGAFNDFSSQMKADIAEINQDYPSSLKILLELAESGIYNKYRSLPIGRVYRKNGQLEEAQEYLLKQLKLTPFSALTHYEIAVVYNELNQNDKSIEHLAKAADIWQEAEEGFKPAEKNRALLAKLVP